ncbi:modulator of DNA gyrase family protein [Bordetella holmesii 41130]|nr:modulator of DNA gyrase family protein [Bordetella holmesii 41130]
MVTSSSSLPIAANHARFSELVEQVLGYARQIGASDAVAEVSESLGLSVSVRKNDIETVEQTRDRSLDLTVYAGQSRGSASTSDFSEAALRQTVEAAWHIARHTAADEAAGLPDAEMLATEHLDLDLHHPWVIDTAAAAELALRGERAARAVDSRITNTDGAGVNTYEGQFVMGNTRGFMGGYPYSRHSLSVAPIAGRGSKMQRDYWYTSERDPALLASPEDVGRYAAERTLARLSARRLRTTKAPVLFEAPLALGLLGAFVQAVSGARSTARRPFWWIRWASRYSPITSTCRKIRMCAAAWARRPLTTKAYARRLAAWWPAARSKAISCRRTRRASWA